MAVFSQIPPITYRSILGQIEKRQLAGFDFGQVDLYQELLI